MDGQVCGLLIIRRLVFEELVRRRCSGDGVQERRGECGRGMGCREVGRRRACCHGGVTDGGGRQGW